MRRPCGRRLTTSPSGRLRTSNAPGGHYDPQTSSSDREELRANAVLGRSLGNSWATRSRESAAVERRGAQRPAGLGAGRLESVIACRVMARPGCGASAPERPFGALPPRMSEGRIRRRGLVRLKVGNDQPGGEALTV